ncbi:MAG: hypothetical protein JWR16_1261 [Nevskia sp.]|nr:hypothetical protein [Nevskia sp.]
MSDTEHKHHLDDIPDAHLIEHRWHIPPLVWVIPLVAALIGGWIVIERWIERGPVISISFLTAEGIEPGKTRIRYKNVDIGRVTAVKFADADGGIIVSAAIDKHASRFLRDDSRLWVVRPRISPGGITGISTLFSGAYISLAAGKAEEQRRDFVGLEVAPINTEDAPGREFVLHTVDVGSLDIGSPVLFRRVKAGRVVGYKLDDDGRGVQLRVFVDAPFDRFVTTDTRFWQASGVDFSFGAEGLKVEWQSLISVVIGGLAFESPADNPLAPPASTGATFTLFGDHDEAMKRPYHDVRPFVVYFNDSLRGLAVGAPVEFRGIVIGEVRSIGIEYDKAKGIFRTPVEIDIYPQRLRDRYREGAPRADDSTDAAHRDLVNRLIAAGMRAQLKTGNLITGQLYVGLDFFAKAAPAKLNWNDKRVELPTVPGGLAQLQDSIGNIADKLDKMPLDQISSQLLTTMRSLDATLHSTSALVDKLNTDVAPEAKAALADARKAMDAAQATLSQESPLQSNLRDTLKQLSRSARALADLSDYLERHPESLIRGKQGGDQ